MLSAIFVKAQFYNGLQQKFGKNRVQYEEFTWKYIRQDNFDVYFYENGRELAYFVQKIADKKIKEYSNFFDFKLNKRIQFLVYNNLSDFRQSNIGLISEENKYNIGGVTKILKNKVFVYFEGDRKKLEEQIASSIVEVFINEMIFGTSFTARMASSTLIALPDWYTKGLISFLSKPWGADINDKVKNGILSGKYQNFNRLTGEDAVYAGHSIWYYIASRYGKDVIPNILYITKTSKNIDSGFMFVIGTNAKYLSYDWLDYFDKIYNYSTKNRELLGKDDEIKSKNRKPRVFQELKVSNNGNLYAYTSNQEGQYRIKIFNKLTGKTKKILKKEHKLAQITDYSYPLLAWHPSNEILAYLIEAKGSFWLNFYDLTIKKTEKRELFGFDKITSISYSNDGKHMVFSAVRKGQSDIYIYNILSYNTTRLTNDIADDFTPSFTKNDKGILFTSTRNTEELNAPDSSVQQNTDVFLISLNKYKATNITRITNTANANEYTPFEQKTHHYIIVSDKNGIKNKYLAKFDSTISFIDTTTHYKYITKDYALSDYAYNLNSFDYNETNKQSGEIFFSNGKYHLYSKNNSKLKTKNISNTYFKNKEIKLKQLRDSIRKIQKHKADSIKKIISQININEIKSKSDTNNINIKNYSFDISLEQAKLNGKPYTKTDAENSTDTTTSAQKDGKLKPFMYFTNFYINDMVSQIDFSFLSNSYQAFTGSGFYFNPGFNMFFKLGAMDLFENYRITGAFRFAGDFDSNEWLVSIENLKKRIDKQLLFHRQSFKNFNPVTAIYTKTNTHILNYILKYPFSQVAAVRLTLGARTDRTVFLATDSKSLFEDDLYKNWGNLKLEYIFDNSRNLAVNIYTGNRIKVWGEAYKQINDESSLFVVGFDVRHYEKIHRNMIWASRIAGSSSFGKSKLIYYLGSVDNWMNFSSKNPTFNSSVQIDYSQNWAFQAVATNMRGFSQNIRNGNSFAVINNEIRWPVFSYFANRPLSSDFINNFQVIGFFDVGTAWTGTSPYSEENKYNQKILPPDQSGPIVLIINKDKNPIVYGYGFGLRSRLLGYFIRADWAWGVEDYIIQPKIFYLSLSLDF